MNLETDDIITKPGIGILMRLSWAFCWYYLCGLSATIIALYLLEYVMDFSLGIGGFNLVWFHYLLPKMILEILLGKEFADYKLQIVSDDSANAMIPKKQASCFDPALRRFTTIYLVVSIIFIPVVLLFLLFVFQKVVPFTREGLGVLEVFFSTPLNAFLIPLLAFWLSIGKQSSKGYLVLVKADQ